MFSCLSAASLFIPSFAAAKQHKTMDTAIFHSINAFFEQYGKALENYDTKHLSLRYAIPCIMLSDDSATTFTESSKLEGLFNQGANFYKQFGIVHARPEVWSKRPVSEKIAHAKVNWQYYNEQNQPVYNCDYFYILRYDKSNKWKIEMSVSINEKERMDEWKERSNM
jgi:hypothetical protein